MKKIFSIVFILFSVTAVAQNVGVGETNPEMKLQVKSADSAVLLLQNSNTVNGNIKTGLYYKTGSYYSGGIATVGSGGTFRMGLFTYGGTNPSSLIERMTISDGGNVGIGTTTPSAKLEVNGLLKLTGGSPATGKFLTSDNTGLASWYDLSPQILPSGIAGQTTRNNGTGWLATSNLYNDGSRIGIGTTSPGSMLEIKSASGTADIEINASAGDNAVLRLNKNGSSNYSTLRFKTSGTNNWDLGMQGSDHFKLQYVPTNSTIMDVDNATRNIGFFTNDFTESVNIGGSLGAYGASITKGINAGFQFQDRTANAYAGWNWYADAGKANLYRYGGLGNTITIDQSGYLGIGTTAPVYRLDVNGRMRIRHNGVTSGIFFNNSSNVESSFIGQYKDDLFGIFGNAWEFAINRNDGTVYLGSSNLDNENLINGAGYKLRVFGKVIAEEVRVQVKNAWPDYVFESGYNKLSITDLEKYVNENKHLPNIPSAKEIEKDGHQLGDVQVKMLEKIEELSLYIIELNKKVKALEEKISSSENKK